MAPNATRQPRAVPIAVERGTPSTSPPDTPTDASAIARPVWVRRDEPRRVADATEKKRAWVMPPTTRPVARTPKVGATRSDDVAHAVAADGDEQDRLARQAPGREGERDRQHGDHHGVRTDQQPGLAGADVERRADLREQADREQLGRHGGEDGDGEDDQAGARRTQPTVSRLEG